MSTLVLLEIRRPHPRPGSADGQFVPLRLDVLHGLHGHDTHSPVDQLMEKLSGGYQFFERQLYGLVIELNTNWQELQSVKVFC